MESNPDFKDLFRCLNDAGARFLVVGAYAVIFHTEPRYTKDLDIWVEPTPANAARVWKALAAFGAPLADLTPGDLSDPEVIFQVGIEPNRFDILTRIKGLRFSQAWKGRVKSAYGGEPIAVLGFRDTLQSKKAAGRPEDLLDVRRLEAKKGKGKAPGKVKNVSTKKQKKRRNRR